jgi:diaminohydroxyphosphoribosylaminopyrimidine deaminase/5-amino-6-(5-phosphoribosylamino)uracil reductase
MSDVIDLDIKDVRQVGKDIRIVATILKKEN